MEEIYSFFTKPKDPSSFNAVRISLASPEKIREWSYGEVKKPKPSITGPLNLKEMGFSVQRYLDLSRTMNVTVASISA